MMTNDWYESMDARLAEMTARAERAEAERDAALAKCAGLVAGVEDVVRAAVIDWNTLGPQVVREDVSEFIAHRIATHAAPEVGRCGDPGHPIFPIGSTQAHCRLPHGHPSWHKGDDGSEWIDATPEADQ